MDHASLECVARLQRRNGGLQYSKKSCSIGVLSSSIAVPAQPQTNGKLERFHRSIEDEIFHYESLSDYVEYYNEIRLHFALYMYNLETSLRAFHSRRASR